MLFLFVVRDRCSCCHSRVRANICPFYWKHFGKLQFFFDAADHSRQEHRSRNGDTTGHFTFVGPDGETNTLDHRASVDTGFVATDTPLPVNQEVLAAQAALSAI